jgi:hypothetical protein
LSFPVEIATALAELLADNGFASASRGWQVVWEVASESGLVVTAVPVEGTSEPLTRGSDSFTASIAISFQKKLTPGTDGKIPVSDIDDLMDSVQATVDLIRNTKRIADGGPDAVGANLESVTYTLPNQQYLADHKQFVSVVTAQYSQVREKS